jgi:hypothetical protein
MSKYDWDSHNAIRDAAKWLPRADVFWSLRAWHVESRPDGQAMPSLVCAGPDARLLCEMLAALESSGWKHEEEE